MQWDNGLLVAWSGFNFLIALCGAMLYRADAKVFRHLPTGDARKQLPLYHLLLAAQGIARSTVFLVYAYLPPDSAQHGRVASEWRRSLIDDLVGLPCLLVFSAFLPRRLLLAVPHLARWRAILPVVVGVPVGAIVLAELLMLASATNADIHSLQLLTTARNCAFTVVAALTFVGYGVFAHHARRQAEEQFVSGLMVARWRALWFCRGLQLCMGLRAALANVAGSDITGASMPALQTWLNIAYYTVAEMAPALLFHASMRPSDETLATARRLKWAYEPLAPHYSVDADADGEEGLDLDHDHDQDHDHDHDYGYSGSESEPRHGSRTAASSQSQGSARAAPAAAGRSAGDLSLSQAAVDVGSLFRSIDSDGYEDADGLLSAEMHIPHAQVRFGAVIGGGGSGEVHRAAWQGSAVAVKVVARNMADRREFLRMQLELAQEAQLWARLRHPRVCLFLGFTVLPERHPLTAGSVMEGSGDAVPVLGLVTEYLAGGALSALLYGDGRDEGAGVGPVAPLPWQQLHCIACDVAAGMAYLHAAHVIHRDLKSHNILLCAAGGDARTSAGVGVLRRAKICDFGISKVFNRRSDMTLTGTLGTVIWTAPEVLRNEPWVAASDVYSFAIVLVEMLTRKLPYGGIHLFAVPLKVAEGYRPPLSASEEGAEAGGAVESPTPPGRGRRRRALEELVRQCWGSDPASRPTFLQIIDRLNEIGDRDGDDSDDAQ